MKKIHLRGQKIWYFSIVCHISYYFNPSPFLQERYLAHIIHQKEHLKIFENHFYKYILKTVFSQRSKMKTSLSSLSWTINLLMHFFCKKYFANIPDELSQFNILTNHGRSIFNFSKLGQNTNSAQKFRPPWTKILRRRKVCISPFFPNNEID